MRLFETVLLTCFSIHSKITFKLLGKKFSSKITVKFIHRYRDIDFDNETIVKNNLRKLNIPYDEASTHDHLASLLKTSITEQSFLTWIDHSAIANKGYLLATLQVTERAAKIIGGKV